MKTLVTHLATGVVALTLVASASARMPVFDEARGVMTTAPLVEKVTPAVVSISVSARQPAEANPLLRDPFFRRFFQMPEREQRPRAMSAGSGVIVDANKGYVLTNHHVIESADEITVILKGDERLDAKLIGSDPETDIALLKVKAKGLTALTMADSDTLRVGDIVFAVGNPFGLGQTVTSGIISALGRGIGMHGYEDFIQTDAPINPGNSGGALVNTRGELVGINTAIIGPAGGNVGIGFAVPTNMARSVMTQLAEHGEVRRGRIGVLIQDLTQDLAEALDIPGGKGVVISRVEVGSPAEAAGLKPGDVLVAVSGQKVTSASDVRNLVGMVERGRELDVTYYRNGQRQVTTVKVGDPDIGRAAGDAAPQLAGARFTDIPSRHPAAGRVEGVFVAEVADNSPAERSGLRENDIIMAVNQKPVSGTADFRNRVRSEKRLVALNILRGSTQIFLVLR